MLLCMLSMAASAQSYQWSGSVDMAPADDTVFQWCDKFRPNQPWSLDVDYTALSDSIHFGIVISDFNNGAFGYYPLNNITWPLLLDPTADAYRGYNGEIKASYPFKARDISFTKFGIMIIQLDTAMTGTVNYRFKQ